MVDMSYMLPHGMIDWKSHQANFISGFHCPCMKTMNHLVARTVGHHVTRTSVYKAVDMKCPIATVGLI